jgi:hypothetical protein
VLLSLLLLVPLLIYRVILLLKPLPRQDFLIYWSAAPSANRRPALFHIMIDVRFATKLVCS